MKTDISKGCSVGGAGSGYWATEMDEVSFLYSSITCSRFKVQRECPVTKLRPMPASWLDLVEDRKAISLQILWGEAHMDLPFHQLYPHCGRHNSLK